MKVFVADNDDACCRCLIGVLQLVQEWAAPSACDEHSFWIWLYIRIAALLVVLVLIYPKAFWTTESRNGYRVFA